MENCIDVYKRQRSALKLRLCGFDGVAGVAFGARATVFSDAFSTLGLAGVD